VGKMREDWEISRKSEKSGKSWEGMGVDRMMMGTRHCGRDGVVLWRCSSRR